MAREEDKDEMMGGLPPWFGKMAPPNKKDGVMIYLLRDDGHGGVTPEVHFPQLGLLTEGRLEQHQMLMYRGLQQARAAQARQTEEE